MFRADSCEALMKVRALSIVFIAFLFFQFAPAWAQSYQSEMDLGVAAYRNSHYQEAMQHFRKAADLDPSQMNAHLYLATACVSQYIPGVDSPENKQFADDAIEQYRIVLDSDTREQQRISSAKGIGYLYLNMKSWDEAKKYYRIASDMDPNDPENFYSLGVIDWTVCYSARMEARAQLKLRPEEHLDPNQPEQRKICDELQAKNLSSIEDGISNLKKAIDLRPDYDDAMAYINLMYRERADVECYDAAARERDLTTADEWVDKTLATKKAKAKKADQPMDATAPSPQ